MATGGRGGGWTGTPRSSVPSSSFSVTNPPSVMSESDAYLVPNLVYEDASSIAPPTYQALGHPSLDLQLRSDPPNPTTSMSFAAQSITTETAITHLPRQISQQSPKVLNLDHNMLRAFPKELCVASIEVLSVQSQLDPREAWKSRWPALTRIPEEIARMRHLRELDLTNNALESLPESLAKLQCLRRVNLQLNYFSVFPGCLLASRSIAHLNLTGNYLKELPAEICQMESLEELILDNNNLQTLPDLHPLRRLAVLSLRNNKDLSRLPKALHECPALREVRVDGNNMDYPPQEECQKGSEAILRYLRRRSENNRATNFEVEEVTSQDDYSKIDGQVLTLRRRQLNNLDILEEKAKRELQVLDVRENELTTLPDTLGKYKMLQTINCDNNHIVTFPLPTLRKIPNLKKLNLSSQHNTNRQTLCEIPMLIHKLHTLQELYLRHNKIQKLEKGICNLKCLRILDLEGNSIKTVPTCIDKLEKLEYLALNNNKLIQLPDAIGALKNLKVLRLSNNSLQELPDSVCELSLLHTLSLRRNTLQRLPVLFYQLKNLLVENSFQTDTMGVCFPNGCNLDKNPNLKFPPPRYVRAGLQDMMDYMETSHLSPDIVEDDEEELQNEPMSNGSSLGGSGPQPTLQAPAVPETNLDDLFLNTVSKDLGPEWQQLALALRLTYTTVEQIKHDHPNNVRHQSMYMLYCWRNAQSGGAQEQKRCLVQALEEIRRSDLASTVESMSIGDT